MHCHPNARATPWRRAEVFKAVEAGMTVTAACLAVPHVATLVLPLAAAVVGRGAARHDGPQQPAAPLTAAGQLQPGRACTMAPGSAYS